MISRLPSKSFARKKLPKAEASQTLVNDRHLLVICTDEAIENHFTLSGNGQQIFLLIVEQARRAARKPVL
jgi:hypothetical protein